MDATPPGSRRVRFGLFEADLRSGELWKQGLTIRLRGRPFDILTLLLDHPGELVTRDELRARLWPADTFVDFDHGLNTSVNRLREALGDTADNPRFVETLPRKGYRFIAPVSELTRPAASPGPQVEARPAPGSGPVAVPTPEAPAAGAPAAQPALPEPDRRRPGRTWALGALALGALLAASIGWFRVPPRTAPAGPPRLAVLPFRNVSGDAGQDYFADGLTDTLIASLAQIDGLRVISRTSVMPYKSTTKQLPEIAKELNVGAVVEGSVLRAGDRVRITARLIDAGMDRNLWAHTYDRDLADILALQGEVASAIAQGVRVAVTPQEQAHLAQPRRIDPRAYEAYLRARYFWQLMTDDNLRLGVSYLEQAIALQPDYAEAYAGLAYCYWVMGGAGFEVGPQSETAVKAKAAATRALELDPSLGSPLATLGMLEIDYDWNFEAGEARILQAIAASPSLAEAHVSYSAYLAAMGRFDEAIAEARKGFDLDPLSVVAGQTLGWRLLYAGQYDRAMVQFGKTLELQKDAFVARIGLAQSLWGKGERRRALSEGQRSYADSDRSPWVLAWLGYAYGASGQAQRAREVLAQLAEAGRSRYISPFYPAMVEVGLGENDKALAALEKAFETRSPWMVFLKVEPEFESLRTDPRFIDLLRRVGHRVETKGASPAAPRAGQGPTTSTP
jgi:TolB-like protein/DNA-binding winged helix-turn-helix (wHTH) protein